MDAGLDVERGTGGKKMTDDNRTTLLAKRRSALTGFALLLALLGAACVLPIQEKASAGVDHP